MPQSGWSKCDKFIFCLAKIQFWDVYNFWSTPPSSIPTADSERASQKNLEYQFSDLYHVQKWRYGFPNTFQNEHSDPWGQKWVVTLTVLQAIKSKPLGILIWSLEIFHCSRGDTFDAILSKIWDRAHGQLHGHHLRLTWALVELGWNDPWNFTAQCSTCKHRFFSEIFCIDSFSPKTNKCNPVPVHFPNFPNKYHPIMHIVFQLYDVLRLDLNVVIYVLTTTFFNFKA